MIYRLHWRDLLETWKGGFYYYAENQLDAIKEALFNYQQKSDPKAAVGVSLTYSSGQVRFVMTASLWFQTDIINSFRLLSLFFMTRPLLRMYLMNSWPSPPSGEMSQDIHSSTSLKVWVLRSHSTAFG
jgi:hypothetical protein